MKRICILVFFCLCGLSILNAQSLTGRKVFVSIKEGNLKSSASIFARNTGTFAYGDEFTVIEQQGSWVHLQGTGNNLSGWTSASNVTTRQIITTGGKTSASADELALAGKAYSPEVEKAYQDASQVDYTAVDFMENISISDEEVLQFIQDGELNLGESE